MTRLRTFDRLSVMIADEDFKEPSITMHIMSLYKHYWHNNNLITFSNCSAHSNEYGTDRVNKINSIENESVTPSITTRSINLAVTVVSELLK